MSGLGDRIEVKQGRRKFDQRCLLDDGEAFIRAPKRKRSSRGPFRLPLTSRPAQVSESTARTRVRRADHPDPRRAEWAYLYRNFIPLFSLQLSRHCAGPPGLTEGGTPTDRSEVLSTRHLLKTGLVLAMLRRAPIASTTGSFYDRIRRKQFAAHHELSGSTLNLPSAATTSTPPPFVIGGTIFPVRP